MRTAAMEPQAFEDVCLAIGRIQTYIPVQVTCRVCDAGWTEEVSSRLKPTGIAVRLRSVMCACGGTARHMIFQQPG